MTVKASLKQADLRRMAIVAKQEGVLIEVELDGRIIRIASSGITSEQAPVAKKEIIRL